MKPMIVEMTHESGTDCACWSTSGQTPLAEAFDRLIRVLAETRRTMEAAFSQTLPVLTKDPPQVDGAAWQWSIEAGCSSVLNLCHPGLGWLSFRMPDVDLFHENLSNVIDQRNALRHELEPPAS